MSGNIVYGDLKDTSVLITGGGTGIGAALTEAFLDQGAKVAFIDIAEEASQKLAADLESRFGSRPLFIHGDLSNVDVIISAAEQAASEHGPVEVLVNNAALDDRHRIEDLTPDYWDRNQSINLRPQVFAAQAVAPGMKRAGRGAIINFTSTSFMLNMGSLASYASAKAGIIGLTKSLAGELGPEGIRVNAVAPGWVLTPRQRELWADPESLARHVERQCLRREMQPEDVIGTCLFLASNAARMITAQTIIVDGGVL